MNVHKHNIRGNNDAHGTAVENKKLSCRRETARRFVPLFVCSQLQQTYSAVFYYQLLRLRVVA